MYKSIITVVAVFMFSGTTFAENKMYQEEFNRLDINSDGVLSKKELKEQPTLIRFTNFFYKDSFRSADINKDGLINLEEYMANEQDTY